MESDEKEDIWKKIKTLKELADSKRKAAGYQGCWRTRDRMRGEADACEKEAKELEKQLKE
jgi:hypothetical protein